MAHLTSVDLLTGTRSNSRIDKDVVHTRSLIIASGASARWLNLPSASRR